MEPPEPRRTADTDAASGSDAPPVTVGGDDQLGLVFACCHPALALEVRVALT